MRGRDRDRRDDAGMAIVELAIAIPVLVAVCALALWAISVGGAALVLGDAARDAARALARGDVPPALPDGVRGERIDDDGLVTVVLARDLAFAGPLGFTVTIEQRSSALAEVAAFPAYDGDPEGQP